jgi:hypothetical protein
MKVNIQIIRKLAPTEIKSSVSRLNLNELLPESKIDKNLELIKALIEKSTVIRIVKFLCSDCIIRLNAFTGLSINIPISCHKSRL